MTRGEMGVELNRLGQGFDVDIRPGQFEAYWDLFNAVPLEVFQRAVTNALCEAHFPSLAQLRRSLERAEEDVRLQRVQRERSHAHALFSGKLPQGEQSEAEHKYGQFRMRLLLHSLGKGPGYFAAAHSEQLAAWLEDEENQQWASTTPMAPKDCGHYPPHKTFLSCIVTEQSYWQGEVLKFEQAQQQAEEKITK